MIASVHQAPLWRTAWRRLRRRPFQYLLLILGVALGVAMTVSIDLASGSASRAFQLSTDAITGKATHHVIGGPTGLDEAVYTRLRAEAGIHPAAPIVEGYVVVSELGGQPIRLVGVDPLAEPPFRDYFGAVGNELSLLVEFLTEPDTVIVSAETAERYGVVLGDALTLRVNGRLVTARVVGLLQPADGVTRTALRQVMFADVATAQELLGMVGRLSRIDLILPDETAVSHVRALLPADALLEPASSQSNAVQQMTAAFRLNLAALSLLALVVGMFLIYNTVTFSVVQRRPLFGILRCLGVTGEQLFRLILAETAVLSLIGSLLGVALGILLGRGMVRLVTQTINDFYFVVTVQDVSIPLFSVVRGVVVGVAAGVVAAILPAWEAMRTPPQGTLYRSALEGKSRRLLPWLTLVWLVLSLAGGLLLWWPQAGLTVAFTGLFAILIGFAFLTPPVTAVAMRLVTPLGGRLFGVLGRMAPRDIIRSISRTSVAIAALMVAVSVIIGVSIMIGSFRQTVTQWLSQTLQADVYLSPPGVATSQIGDVLPEDVVQTAVSHPAVIQAVTARHVAVQLPELGRTVELVAVDGDVSAGQRAYAWIDGQRETLWARFAAGEGIFVSETLLIKEGLPVPPPPLTLLTPEGARQFPVLAVFYDYSSDRGTILMDRESYISVWGDTAVSTIGLFVRPETAVDELVADLQQQFQAREDVLIQSNQEIRQEALAIFDRTFAITAALRLLAVIVAFIGILSALMSLQLERAREFGVLRATGMTLRQLWQLTLMETGLMGALAGVLAMPAGFVLAWVLIYVINVRSFGWTLQMRLEPGYFGQALAVSLLAALLAGVYPMLRLGRIVIATALRQE